MDYLVNDLMMHFYTSYIYEHSRFVMHHVCVLFIVLTIICIIVDKTSIVLPYKRCIFYGLLHPIRKETKKYNRPKQKQRIPRLSYGSQSLYTYDVTLLSCYLLRRSILCLISRMCAVDSYNGYSFTQHSPHWRKRNNPR